MSNRILTIACASLFAVGFCSDELFGQQQRPTGISVQLPTTSFFNIRTVVSAPDAGITSLGGVRRSYSRGWSAGIPGLGNLPVLGRPFRNRAVVGGSSASNSGMVVRIISNKELDEDTMAKAGAIQSIRELHDPNGSRAVQAQADFLSRNIGRRDR